MELAGGGGIVATVALAPSWGRVKPCRCRLARPHVGVWRFALFVFFFHALQPR